MHCFLIGIDYGHHMASAIAFPGSKASHTAFRARWNLPLAYIATWLTIIISVPIATAVLMLSGMRFQMTGILVLSASVAMLCAGHFFYMFASPQPRLALATGSLSMMILASFLSAIICHAGLRLEAHWIDNLLDATDKAMGINTPELALWLALNTGFGPIFDIAYKSTAPAIFSTALWLSYRGQTDRTWELGFCYSACILTASVISAAFPAIGSTVYHQIDGSQGLPLGAGDFHLGAIEYFRNSNNPIFDWRRVNGVVTFPSFHMVMAILIPYACRNIRIVFPITAAWGVLVAISAICIGGHYVIDLVGGTVIWGACALLLRKMAKIDTKGRSSNAPNTASARQTFLQW